MKIGLLSDTHRKTDLHAQTIDNLLTQGVEYLLHAGDIHSQEHLQMLRDTNLPFAVVFGNNDYHLLPLSTSYPIYQEPYYFKIKNIRVKMMHMPLYMSADTDIIIFGHTHISSIEMINGKLFINPGEVCAREKRLTEHAIVEILDKEWRVDRYFKEPDAKEWITESQIYDI
jgi:putative phosphoesterase